MGGWGDNKKANSQFRGIMPTSHLPFKAFLVAVWHEHHAALRSAVLDTIDARFCHLPPISNLIPPLLG